MEMSDAPRVYPQWKGFYDNVESQWKGFYDHARALHNKGKKDINKVEYFRFPKDNDPTLYGACEALSNTLQDASNAIEVNDNAEVKQAVDNLRKAYDDAAASNTVTIRYIEAEPPCTPYSPLYKDTYQPILARPWMMELISQLRNQSFPDRLVIIGDPGSGECLRFNVFLGLHS